MYIKNKKKEIIIIVDLKVQQVVSIWNSVELKFKKLLIWNWSCVELKFEVVLILISVDLNKSIVGKIKPKLNVLIIHNNIIIICSFVDK